MRGLPELVADLLEARGAAVEQAAEGGLGVIAPPELAQLLGVPEYCRLSFAGEAEGGEAIHASYDSDYFRSLERLLPLAGWRGNVKFERPAVRPERIAETLAERLPLVNATARLERMEVRPLCYFLIYFRYAALSDDRQEGMFSLLVNGLNASISLLEDPLENMSPWFVPLGEPVEETTAAELIKILGWANRAAAGVVQERLSGFIQSAERRLNRDVKRVYEYYEDLKAEIERRIARKLTPGEGRAESPGDAAAEEMAALSKKREAVTAECQWKIQDLSYKYALTIQNNPLCVLRIQTTAPVFFLKIKRRLSSRIFPASYNPLLKQLDPLPCESCCHPSGAYHICDDQLHIICDRCNAATSRSGKGLCPLCNGTQKTKGRR